MPWSVLDCPAYARLSHPAKSLLFEVARQYVRDNNGRMLLSRVHMKKRGWKSSDVIDRAKRELLDAGFIFQTVMGHRPNKASWFAVTWQTLDKLAGYDAGVEKFFQRGAYRVQPLKNASLNPPHGAESPFLAPPHGLEQPLSSPSHGAVRPLLAPSSTPPHGHHLEIPSAATQSTH
jgi:hypothetical protein